MPCTVRKRLDSLTTIEYARKHLDTHKTNTCTHTDISMPKGHFNGKMALQLSVLISH